MRNLKTDWTGCYPAVVTPFNADGTIDEKAFQENIELLVTEGAHGFVIAGCTGEAWALTDDEKIRLFDLASEQVSGRAVVIAGTPGLYPAQVIALEKGARAAGCQGIMVQPPASSLPSAEEIFDFFAEVDAQVKLPIMAYNIPKRAAVSMSPQLIARLATLDGVVAIKQSSGSFDELVETIMRAGPRLRVFAGYSAKRGLPSTVMGADGYVTSTEPQVFGKEGIDLWQLSLEGRVKEALNIQFRAVRLGQAIWEGKGTFPAPIKAAMNLLGRPGGYPRPPIKPLTPEGIEHLRQVLIELELLPA